MIEFSILIIILLIIVMLIHIIIDTLMHEFRTIADQSGFVVALFRLFFATFLVLFLHSFYISTCLLLIINLSLI